MMIKFGGSSIGRACECGSHCCGFESRPSTHFSGSIRPVAYSDSKKIGHLPLMILTKDMVRRF